jgi:ABC-type transporter Mla maintaining outer membrane lipid asymmetry ATPase subunit MlaF
MSTPGAPVLDMRGIVKSYGGLRPIRIAELQVNRGERVAVAGLDAPAAELIVNLITGASLPDEGSVRVLGQPTSELTADAWLPSLDRFGIVSPRAVLLDAATLEQNLALPFTLEIDPVPVDVAVRARALAARCGIRDEAWLKTTVAELPPEVRVRTHLARAVAHGPALLLLEHPTAELAPAARAAFGADVAAACATDTIAALAITNDEAFAAAMTETRLQLEAATGRLSAARRKGWWR